VANKNYTERDSKVGMLQINLWSCAFFSFKRPVLLNRGRKALQHGLNFLFLTPLHLIKISRPPLDAPGSIFFNKSPIVPSFSRRLVTRSLWAKGNRLWLALQTLGQSLKKKFIIIELLLLSESLERQRKTTAFSP